MGKKTVATLDRALSQFGFASRTAAREIIRQGRVTVNGNQVREPERWVNLRSDVIRVDGMRVKPKRRIYLLFNKPKGVVTTYVDLQGRTTVYDYLKQIKQWVFPVGRLDKNTSGLLLLTNDTRFGDYITNPRSKVPKTYLVKVKGVLTDDQINRLSQGIVLDDGEKTLPAEVRRVRQSEKATWLEVTIIEGKNRQIRRMLAAIGHTVLKLVRVKIGNLELGDLPVGQYRFLSDAEVRGLKTYHATKHESNC